MYKLTEISVSLYVHADYLDVQTKAYIYTNNPLSVYSMYTNKPLSVYALYMNNPNLGKNYRKI